MKALKKLFKFVFGLVVTLLVVAVLLVLTLPFWIGPVVKTAANRTVPGITGTDFRLGEFGLNFYTGKVRLGDIRLGNPEGYSPSDAVRLGLFNIDVDVGSCFEDTIIIHEIALRDVYVSYVTRNGKTNFDVISDNIAGEKTEEAVVEETTPSEGSIKIEWPQTDEEEAPQGGSKLFQKRVIIDRVEISGLTFQWEKIPLPLPKIVLKDIGRDSGGVSWDAACHEIMARLLERVNSLGKGLISVTEAGFGAATNGLNAVTGAVNDSAAVVTEVTTQTVDTLKASTAETVETLKSSTAETVNTFTSAVKGGASATGDVTRDTVKTTADLTGGVLKTTGETAADVIKASGETTREAFKATGDTLKAAGKELKAAGKDIKNMFKNNK